MKDKQIISNKAPEPVGPYPHARRVGDLLFLSGIGPRNKASKEIPGVSFDENKNPIAYDVKEQTHQVIQNLRLVLQESGLELKDVVDIQVYLINMKKDFKAFNEVYAMYFSVQTGPTRTTVEVGALPTPIAVEFKVIATFQ